MRALTLEHFRALFPHCPLSIANEQLPLLNATMRQYRINNKLRIAAFCATLAQESGEFRYRMEIASGWDYEGRKDLGNDVPGDGPAMKGHGRIQLTGRDNHTRYARYVQQSGHLPYIDFSQQHLANRVATDPYALDSSGWFWTVLKDLNPLADRGNFLATQIKVNGRNKRTKLPNHWAERHKYYERALRILPDDIGFEEAGPIIAATAVATEPQEMPVAASPATDAPTAIDSVLKGGMLTQAVSSEGSKQAGKKILARVGLRLGRPLLLFYGALEAGNLFAWLGVVVLVVGAGVVIYLEREHLKRAVVWLSAKARGL